MRRSWRVFMNVKYFVQAYRTIVIYISITHSRTFSHSKGNNRDMQSRLNMFWGPGPAELMGPLPPLSLPSLPSRLPFSPLLPPPLPSPPLPLEVGPLNPARGSGGAL